MWTSALFIPLLVGLASSQGRSDWWEGGASELERALKVRHNTGRAQNVILFVGDGMGVNTVTASRIYQVREQGLLSFESFPHLAMLKTYSTDKQVSDSAATGTALFCGVKTNYETVGLDARVVKDNCSSSLDPDVALPSIMTWAQQAGKATGIVTTTRVTHATPAATYAHSASRYWECDDLQPDPRCKDIGRQLVEDLPGRDFRVILGGGRQTLVSGVEGSVDEGACVRKQGDLVAEWRESKRAAGARYAVVASTSNLTHVDLANTDYLLGVFSNSHMPYASERDMSSNGQPSLPLMTTTAINMLKKYKQGFVLMVESGMIDQGHHAGRARLALDEAVALSEAVSDTMDLLEEAGIAEETLVIVTADHGHTLSINGYPELGNNILGVAGLSKGDGVAYTTLTYGVGHKNNYKYKVVEGTVRREDPSLVDTTAYSYRQQAAVPYDISAHGGGDVALYATGPMAHLFHSVHEQSYVAQVVSYAARIGHYAEVPPSPASGPPLVPHLFPLFSYLLALLFH